MKITLSLLLILLSTNIYAQRYQFDLLTNYDIQTESRSNDRLVYSNTKDPNIFLMVMGNSVMQEARLLDIDRSMAHYFNVMQTVENGEVFFAFDYLKSEVIKPQKSFLAHDFSVHEIAQDSVTKTIEVRIYKNAKKKKVAMSQVLTMTKYPINLFPLYRVSGLHPFEILSKIDIPYNYIVTGGTGTTFLGGKLTTKLMFIKAISLELVVPE